MPIPVNQAAYLSVCTPILNSINEIVLLSLNTLALDHPRD